MNGCFFLGVLWFIAAIFCINSFDDRLTFAMCIIVSNVWMCGHLVVKYLEKRK